MSKSLSRIEFDGEHYLNSNPDLTADLDLEAHYRLYGWREGRDPSPHFESSFYAERNVGFERSHSDPLSHYNEIGRFNGRSPLAKNTRLLSELPRATCSARVAVHCRVTDLSLWPEICGLLAATPDHYSIILSTDDLAEFEAALRYAEKYEGLADRVSCLTVPSGLLDIEVLLYQLRERLGHFDVWGHVYTDWQLAPRKRGYLLSQTIGSEELMERYVGQLVCDSPAGLCFSERKRDAKSIQASAEGWPHLDPDLSYPSEGMFWVRSDVLELAGDCCSDHRKAYGSPDQRRLVCLHAICDAAVSKGYGFYAMRARIVRPHLVAEAAEGAKANMDQRGDRWRALSPSITENRPLALPDRPSPVNSQRIDLHWVVPDFTEGGGGHMTIFRFVHLLEKANFRQTIWLQNAFNHATPAIAHERIKSWYQPISDDVIVRFLPDDVEAITGDAVIATDCWTAFPVSRMTRFKERFYFIQDWETEFHPAGDLRLAASLTYQFGFTALTAGKWLAQKAAEAGMDVVCWTLGADKTNYLPKAPSQISDSVFKPHPAYSAQDVYSARKTRLKDLAPSPVHKAFEHCKNGERFSLDEIRSEIPHIALYARSFTPRRAVDLALAGLKTLASRGWLFHVHLYGEDRDFGELPFIYTPHGVVDPQTLGRIYASCDLGIAFSATNYSLVPLEMMASDLPVLEIDTESTRAAYPLDAVVRARPAAYSVADELEALFTNPMRRHALISAGRKFVGESDWNVSATVVADAITSRIIAKSSADVSETIEGLKVRSTLPILPAPTAISAPAASIFIPTFNAGRDFDVILQSIAEQVFESSFELVVIDSGSTDETIELVKKWSRRIRTNLISINNDEFGHGRTRNQGIEASEGEYIAILTQDACPASPTWLQKLVDGFGAGDRVAGVFGRHIAYPIHDLFEGSALRDFFEKFRLLGPVYSMDDRLPGYVHRGTPNWQSVLQFYSDNNSCMRKSVWKIVPYQDVPWGEDQVWAWEVMRLGFQKAYAHDAPVYHSHDYLVKKLMQVGNEEGRMFLDQFGMYIGIDGDRSDATEAIMSMVRGSVANDAKIFDNMGIDADALLLRRALQYLALFVGRSNGVTQAKRRLRR